MDDSQLLARATTGDDAAFEALVHRHLGAVWSLAGTMVADAMAAEEVVQDTFLKAHASLASFRGDSALRTWLLTICRRTCLDHLRRRGADVVSLEAVRSSRAPTPDPHLRLDLEHAVATLGPAEREAFTLVDVLGYSREEAAEVIGCPPSTMRSRVARARARLAELLDDHDHDHDHETVAGA